LLKQRLGLWQKLSDETSSLIIINKAFGSTKIADDCSASSSADHR